LKIWERILEAARADRAEEVGDFTTTWRVIPITALAIPIGVLSSYVALALLKLIGLFTNIFFFQRFSAKTIEKSAHR